MSCEKVVVSQSQLQPLLLKDYLITTDVNNCPQQGRGGGGYSGFQVTGILSKDLFGFEIFDS